MSPCATVCVSFWHVNKTAVHSILGVVFVQASNVYDTCMMHIWCLRDAFQIHWAKLCNISLQENLEQQSCLHGTKWISMHWLQNISENQYLNGSVYLLQKGKRYYQDFLLQTLLMKRLSKTVTYDTANSSYVNRFLRTGNCLPRKRGGANYVVVSDSIQAYIEPLFLCNPMLYLSEIRERDQDDLQLRFHNYLPFVYVSKD